MSQLVDLKHNRESFGYVVRVDDREGLVIQDEQGQRFCIRRQLAGLEPGENLGDRYRFGDKIRVCQAGTGFSGRPFFAAIPPARVVRPINPVRIIVDASNVSRDGEADPTRPCFGGVGLWAACSALFPVAKLELILDGNLQAVCSDLPSRRAFSALRPRVELLTLLGAEADREILRRVEASGFTCRVLTNDHFRFRKNRKGEVIGRWSDIFPWLQDTNLRQRILLPFGFDENRFVCDRLGVAADVPIGLFD